jgi:hypothetical protein
MCRDFLLKHFYSYEYIQRAPRYVRFEVFTAVTMKNSVFWDVTPCGSCKNVSKERIAYIIRVTRIGEVGPTLAATSNRRTLRRNTKSLGIASQRASVASYSWRCS